MSTLTATSEHQCEALIESALEAETVRDLFGEASRRLRLLVPFDASVWVATDPVTFLPTAPTRSENLAHIGGSEECLRIWEREYLGEDVLLYRDLARSKTPAAALRQATRDLPARSLRYREFLRPSGFDDELRAVLRIGSSAWAAMSLFREHGRPPFTAAETDLVASLSTPLATALRDHVRASNGNGARAGGAGPGLMLFAPDGRLLSINDDARVWLDELPAEGARGGPFDVALPMVVVSTLIRARAIAEQRDHGRARARVRSLSSGRWVVCHASCLRGSDGELGNTALVLEAAKASDIAPLIVQAYELSEREREITELISQGFGTAQIAGRLHLSPHTVRDYVKAIFEKVGVSSRGELVATLFTDHYAPVHFDPSGLDAVSD